MRIHVLALTAALSLAPDLHAQDSLIQRGAIVRLSSAESQGVLQRGTVIALQGDTLRIQLDGQASTSTVGLGNIARIERRTGTHSNALKGAFIGTAVGFGTGMMIGLLSGNDPPGDMSFSAADKGVIFGVALGVVGLASGTVVGAFVRTDTWTPVALPRHAVRAPSVTVWKVGLALPLSRR